MMITEFELCTGCGACLESCLEKAIIFRENEEGFLYPSILPEKCIECGKCQRICPANQKPEPHAILSAYAAQIKDDQVLKDSSSGGLFTAFAREIFDHGGIVYGCVWNENYDAVIVKAANEKELESMRGSKYVWSWAGNSFPEIKAHLESGRSVLFSGLPCQAAGLRKYLGKDYEQLILVDFFCGGVPSPLAFREYLKTLTKNTTLSGLNLKFRDKERDGAGVHISFMRGGKKVYQSYVQNAYYYSFYTKVFHRLCCYKCRYRYEERVSDITIGDYWGIEKYHQEFDHHSGVSALLVNTDKGAALLEKVSDSLRLSETDVRSIAENNNLTLGKQEKVFTVPANRKAIFRTLKNSGWHAMEMKYLNNKTRIKLWLKTKLPVKVVAALQTCLNRK